jgi:hypothetical protein
LDPIYAIKSGDRVRISRQPRGSRMTLGSQLLERGNEVRERRWGCDELRFDAMPLVGSWTCVGNPDGGEEVPECAGGRDSQAEAFGGVVPTADQEG